MYMTLRTPARLALMLKTVLFKKYICQKLFTEIDKNRIRSDLGLTDNSPSNPVRIPYSALTTNYVANLVISGYAASV